jgi:formamidopyrimidine-DNA glycosylase
LFELPEFVILAKQMNETLTGKTIQRGTLGNSPHKFVWYNRSHDEFEELTRGKKVGEAYAKGRWLFVPLEPGYMLLFGECGGKIFYHPPDDKIPKKYHLYIAFEDGSSLTAKTQMWGAMELYQKGEEQNRQYVKDMNITPIEPEFTLEYFSQLIDQLSAEGKKSAKSLLTQNQTIPGLGNSIAQDILFRARLHPKHAINEFSKEAKKSLHDAIIQTINDVIGGGGRYDEYDLYQNKGGYVRLMDKNALKKPCPECGGAIKKIQYLGGSCYFCPNCQE